MADVNDSTKATTGADSDAPVMFGLHVVAIVDLLGQTDELLKWDSDPQQDPPPAQWQNAVKNTYGRVILWRDEFERRFAEYLENERGYREKLAPKDPPKVRRAFDEYGATNIDHRNFSDSLIFYSPLQNEFEYWQVGNIAGMIVTCGSLLLEALASKTVFRGAIEIGMLTHLPPDAEGRPGDPYGPAIARAHYLENKVAQYPRVIVGPKVLKYLELTERNLDKDAASEANRQLAKFCRQYICIDDDHWIVDYLGKAFLELSGEKQPSQEIHQLAYQFVCDELNRFRKEENKKLKKRYKKLRAYFRSRGLGSS